MTTFYFEIQFEILDKSVPQEFGRMAWKSNQPEPTNEIKNHLKQINLVKTMH